MESHRTFVINLVQYVPYQLCPLCLGHDSDCIVCAGKRIIPMHVISNETKKERVEIDPFKERAKTTLDKINDHPKNKAVPKGSQGTSH